MDSRVAREKDFHDERFADGIGARKQDKYYTALRAARDSLDEGIVRCTRRGGTGLEVGCSTGEYLERLLGLNSFKAHGIDISDAAVKAAQGRLQAIQPAPEVEVMDANDLRYRDEMFDFCFGSGVLHHLTLPDAFHEIRRILKPGGEMLFLEPLATNPIISLYRHLTPDDRSVDETPLSSEHLRQLREVFPDAEFRYFGFLSLACVLLNRWPTMQKRALMIATAIDRIFFLLPAAWRLAWVVVISARR